MNTLYHWVGFVAAWLMFAGLLLVACIAFYQHIIAPHFGNALLWVRVRVFGEQWITSRRQARILTGAYQKYTQLARWERNLIAYSIKQYRRSAPVPSPAASPAPGVAAGVG